MHMSCAGVGIEFQLSLHFPRVYMNNCNLCPSVLSHKAVKDLVSKVNEQSRLSTGTRY